MSPRSQHVLELVEQSPQDGMITDCGSRQKSRDHPQLISILQTDRSRNLADTHARQQSAEGYGLTVDDASDAVGVWHAVAC